ncbi:23S rRNA (adenine(2503)-C(2))-methyltransferase RlmN [Patescibacteria group bacterium]
MIELNELRSLLVENGIPSYRANQVLHAVYKEGKANYDDMKVLPAFVKEYLEKNLPVLSIENVKEEVSSNGSTYKALFRLHDGKKIEAVLMRFKDGRKTVCVSSQVGCTLKCKFCATGKRGFKRDLTYEEITDQVLYFQHLLKKEDSHVGNIVFMGMGEPFLNYENVMKAISILNDPVAFNIGLRNITVSTSGIVPQIEQFAEDAGQVNLAVSLHAPNDQIRTSIMPIAKKYSLEELMAACKGYAEKTHRRVSYEYVMLRGVNDSDSNAHELSRLLHGQLCHVNLIPYNETNVKGMKGSTKSRTEEFKKILELHKIPVTVRISLGKDIKAACGQLAGKSSCNSGQ